LRLRRLLPRLVAHPFISFHSYFFNAYSSWFRSGAFGQAIARIPMLNICDDHVSACVLRAAPELTSSSSPSGPHVRPSCRFLTFSAELICLSISDGFGSYPDETQSCPVFSTCVAPHLPLLTDRSHPITYSIGARGLFWYLLFQMFIVDDIDGTSPTPNTHPTKSMIIGGEGAWVPLPSHSFLSYLGPKVYILLLDCRTERRKDQVCSSTTYDRVFAAIRALPAEVDHLIMLLGRCSVDFSLAGPTQLTSPFLLFFLPSTYVGVPILYPRMNAIESVLESKWNPMSLVRIFRGDRRQRCTR
jgi:hypothetical protein